MKRNRKLGQALIEYVLLLVIPVLLISVLPSLNETVNLTLNTVGVDLMEPDEKVTPDYQPDVDKCQDGSCQVILYPPVAKFELPNNCGTKGIYRKGADIRLADVSYDTDPENKGRIDKVEWTVTKYDADGNLVEECSTTHQDEVIHVSRIAGAVSEVNGLTLSMNGYGGLTQYKNCIRDPGKFIVTQRVFDNDGLLSKNTHSETFEIRDLRPSIYLSVEVAQDSTPQEGNFPTYVKEYSQSDSCRYDVPIGGNYNSNKYGLPQIRHSNDADILYYKGLPYAYTEMCPRVEGATSGKATFRIESSDYENGNGNILKDPDFIATSNGGDNEEIPEGASTELYGYQRHGFTYKSRYIQSEALYPDDLANSNVQVIEFDDGATTYVKEFDNAGIYLYDVQVYDENMISAQGKGVQSRNDYQPDVGVAVRVISKLDPDYKDKCDPPVPVISCPKPHYILGITKTTNNSNTKIGPYYFSLGVVGTKANNSKYTESDLISVVENNKIRDENNQSIKDKFLYSVQELEEELGMEVFKTTYAYDNGKTVQIPVFRPTNDDHLSIKALTYYPVDGIQFDECKAAGSSRYWATTNGFLNDFDFQTLRSGRNAQWQPGEEKGDVWFEIQRPYDDDLQETLYYSAETIVSITQGMPLQDKNGKTIENVEVLFGMARNNLAEQSYFDNGNTIASPFNGQLTENDTEPFSGIKQKINPDGSNSEVKFNSTSIRSNGQLFAIAPILQSCPTHNLRPIPYFSYITDNDDVIQLTARVQGMDPNTGSTLNWSIDTQNPPAGITCLDEGCFVTLTAAESICGPEAQNCNIKALRWRYSMYTHKPIQGTGAVTETEMKNAEAITVDDVLTRYFPLTDINSYNNQVGSAYPKYSSIFYPKGTPETYQITTMDDSYDKTYGLPVNNNSSGSYIYYGEYNSASEIAAEDGLKTYKTPTFDFYGKNKYSVAEIRQSGTTAPNAQEIYTDIDSPDIPAGNSAIGMFLQAGTTYVYEIEVIDSQGCATSRTLNINISDKEDEPVAMCNFIDNKVDLDDLANYNYYGGLIVQARSTAGRVGTVYNGDLTQMYTSGDEYYELYTSPLYMLQRSRDHIVNWGTRDGNAVDIGEDKNYFLWDYDAEEIPLQQFQERSQYNVRVGQIAVGQTSFDGILNAAYSKVNEDASMEENAQTINEIVWNAYKADFVTETTTHTRTSTARQDEVTITGNKEHILENQEDVAGVVLAKVGENPTPVGTAKTTHIEDYPVFPEGTFAEPGYYIIELTVSYIDDKGAKRTSAPTECKTKVTTPTLDFKCPWGETITELKTTALNMKESMNENYILEYTPSEDIFSPLAQTNYLIDNYNPNITGFEITTQFNNDANNKDLVETNYNTSIITFDRDKLNEFWNNLKQYGYVDSAFTEYKVCTSSTIDDYDCRQLGVLDEEHHNSFINSLYYQSGSATLNPLTLHVFKDSSKTNYSADPMDYHTGRWNTENEVKPTETMSLQGWIVRERLTRDKTNVQGSTEYIESYYPGYLSSIPEAERAREVELLNTPMTDAQINALDDFLTEITNIYDGLYDIKNYKFKIAHMLKYTDQTEFTFMDLQPPTAVEYTGLYSWSRGVSNVLNDYLYTQYTGMEKTFDEEGNISSTCKNANSIRNCNDATSNSYQTYSYGNSIYHTTPFMGKYDAAKRFQYLNYKHLMNHTPGESTDLLSPIYIGYEWDVDWMYNSDFARLNVFNYKNYFINPFSVYVNNSGMYNGNQTIADAPLNKQLTVQQAASKEYYNNNNSGVTFGKTMPQTLSANSDFLLSSNRYEYNVDTNTLNDVTYQHNYELGRNEDSPNPLASITYVRVNAFDTKNKLPDGSSNTYSKLCPIMVTGTPENDIPESPCNIGLTIVGNNNYSKTYIPNTETGLLTNPDNGQTYVAGYDAWRSNSYNLAAYHTYSANTSIDELIKIPAPKTFASSEYNLADIGLNKDIVMEFIRTNANTTLEKAVYNFYWDYGSGGRGYAFDITLNYNLSSERISAADDAAVSARADRVINDFKKAYYLADGSGKTKHSAALRSTASEKVETEAEAQKIKWEYAKLAYDIHLYDDKGQKMEGASEKSCGFYVARQVSLYWEPPLLTSDPAKYIMEIGDWNYRIQYTSGPYAAPQYFIHWDRTYDYEKKKGMSLLEPNAACMWGTYPYGTSKIGKSGASSQILGKYGDTTYCQEAGERGRSFQTITKDQARPYVREYKLINNSEWSSHVSSSSGYQGFYWVDLFVTHKPNATKAEIEAICSNAPAVSSSEIYKQPGQDIGTTGYWCRKGTLYALTNKQNKIAGLSGEDVVQVIYKQNKWENADFLSALRERARLSYGKNY